MLEKRTSPLTLEIVKSYAEPLSHSLMKAVQIVLAVKMAYRKH